MSTDAVCPECRAQDWDETIDEVAAVCLTCGCVVHDFPVEKPPDDVPPTADQSTEDKDAEVTWAETYTVSSGMEQRLGHALEQLEAIADELEWPVQVRMTAAEILGQAAKQQVVDGRPFNRIVAATLYLAGRIERQPRPLARVARAIDTDPQAITDTSRVLQHELNLAPPVCSATAYLPFLCAELGFSDAAERRADALVEAVEQMDRTTGTSPPGLAAAAMYEAVDRNVTQRELAYQAGVTTETIRVRLHDIRQSEDLDE